MGLVKRQIFSLFTVLLLVGLWSWNTFPGRFWGPFLTALSLLLFLGGLFLHRGELRDPLKRRALLFSGNLLLEVGLLLGILVAVNLLALRFQRRVDFTEGKVYSLAPQTVQILKSLKEPISVYAFFSEALIGNGEETLRLYSHFGKRKFTYTLVDPNRNPGLARRFNVTADGTVVILYRERQEKLMALSEEELTNGIIKLTRERSQTLCFLKGHGEGELEEREREGLSTLKGTLEKMGYNLRTLSLAEEGGIPEECTLLVVAGPKKGLFPAEASLIGGYLRDGKSALFLLDPGGDSLIPEMLKPYGVSVDNDVIVDLVSRTLSGDPLMPIVEEYQYHEITKHFKLPALFPLARSVSAVTPLPSNVTVVELAKTSKNAWGETDLAREGTSGRIAYTEGRDRVGPLSLAVAVESVLPGTQRTGRTVVVGDSDFAKNGYIGASGNENLLLNIIAFLSQEENLISLTPRAARTSSVTLTRGQGNFVFFLGVVLIPLVLFLVGMGVWLRRRRL